jgi:hypothetical protein|tara:strand:- start:665 stop:976 length:312 start_codon:yes stop_codon:yes gene_type:complete
MFFRLLSVIAHGKEVPSRWRRPMILGACSVRNMRAYYLDGFSVSNPDQQPYKKTSAEQSVKKQQIHQSRIHYEAEDIGDGGTQCDGNKDCPYASRIKDGSQCS